MTAQITTAAGRLAAAIAAIPSKQDRAEALASALGIILADDPVALNARLYIENQRDLMLALRNLLRYPESAAWRYTAKKLMDNMDSPEALEKLLKESAA